MPAVFDGVRQYVVLTNQGVSSVAADDGKLLWRHKRAKPYGTEVVNSPMVLGNQVLVTVGSGQGCELLAIQPTSVFDNRNLANHHGNVVVRDGHAFGHSEGRGWTCINLQTGEPAWSDRKLRGGAITYADGHFYSLAESDGSVTLVEADARGWKQISTLKLPKRSELRKPKGGVWTPPVVSGGKLFVRDQNLLFCYEVKGGG